MLVYVLLRLLMMCLFTFFTSLEKNVLLSQVMHSSAKSYPH